MLLAKYGSTELHINPEGRAIFERLSGKRAIICPNHPSWDDSDMIFALSKLVDENFYYLTAWEVFHGQIGYRYWLQHIGCYSVVRGFPDRLSFKTTRDLLVAGRHKIVIFPEGEISHDSRKLLPPRPGMVRAAFSALQQLVAQHKRESLYLIPLVLKYRLHGDVEKVLQDCVWHLESALDIYGQDSFPLHLRVKRVADALLRRLEGEYRELPEAESEAAFSSRIDRLRGKIIEHVSAELSYPVPAGLSQIEAAHVLQSVVYRALYDKRVHGHCHPEKLPPRGKLRLLAKDLHRVVDFISISDDFVSPDSSFERLAELIDLLENEILHCRTHKGIKTVSFHVGEPIDLLEYYDCYQQSKRTVENEVLSRYQREMERLLSCGEDLQPVSGVV